MDLTLATVLAVHNQFAAVRTDEGDGVATLAGRLRRSRPVVGDVVGLRETPDGSLRIEEIEERRGTLTRAAFRGMPQVVAANVDLLVIVAATADPPLRANLIDRYLVAAWRGGIDAALALTKIDLPHDTVEVARVTALLRRLGHAVIEVSIPRDEGVAEVRELIGQRRAVLAGHSGVGKTTLSNAITGRADPTGAVNEVIGRGRQTTTVARLIDLPGGGGLIDTAGVRSFGIADVTPEELQEAFPEIAAVSGSCRWRPCLHHEGQNGCAVPGAPGIEPERLASYLRILEELEEERPER
jgi:ribosome biogenesis GTPase / thiamine phosphate phosphatase